MTGVCGVKAVLLAPGSGSGSDHRTLVALDAALSTLTVRRMDFAYRLAGRRFPDRREVLVASVVREAAAVAAQAGVAPREVLLGGRSMGGRMCSYAVAEGLDACGLVFISYPLHPPDKPDALRDDHFEAIGVPCLFVSGINDGFGTREELERSSAAIRGPVTHVWVERGRHELALVRDQPVILDAVTSWLRATFGWEPPS